MKSVRTEGAVLVARRDGEYYFVTSVFDHGDLSGCTGMSCWPVTEEMMDDMLSIESLIERFGDYWEEKYEGDAVCEACDGHIDEDGCEDCSYPSLCSFCAKIGAVYGSDAVIDDPGGDFAEALDAVCDDKIEYADCTGCGRIFGSNGLDDFDEVYNRKALVACLAYEDGAVDYNYAVRIIFGK